MELIRLDSNPHPNPDKCPNEHRQTEFGPEIIDENGDPEGARLRISFPRFGVGEQRRPSFAVEVNWMDLRRFVRKFIEIGHPDALYLRRMIRLAEAIEKAGWNSDEAPLEDFWEILPPQSKSDATQANAG